MGKKKGSPVNEQKDEYVKKRASNNKAVRKCRQSQRQQESVRKERIDQLREENQHLSAKSEELQGHYQILSQLVTANLPQRPQVAGEAVPVVMVVPAAPTSPSMLAKRVILHPVSTSPARTQSPIQQRQQEIPSPTLSISLVAPSTATTVQPKMRLVTTTPPPAPVSPAKAPDAHSEEKPVLSDKKPIRSSPRKKQ